MPAPGVTYNEVAEAAEQIKKEGFNPTVERVRNKLGTGSNTTISEHLRTWKFDALRISADMPIDILKAINSLILRAEKVARDEFEEEKQKLKGLLEEAIALGDDRANKIESLEEQLANEQQKHSDVLTALSEKEAECDEALSELRAVKLEKEKLASRLDEVQSRAERLAMDKDELNEQLVKVVQENEQKIKGIDAAHKAATRELTSEHKQALALLKKEHQSANDEMKATLKTTVEELKAEHGEALSHEKSRYDDSIAALREDITSVRENEGRLQDMVNKGTMEKMEDQVEIAQLNERCESFKEQLKEAKMSISELTEEKLALTQENARLSTKNDS